MFGHILTADSVTVVLNSKTLTAQRSHQNWDAIIQAIKDKRVDILPGLFNIALALKAYANGKIKIDEDAGVLYHEGKELHSVLVTRIIQMLREGFDINPMVNFLANLMLNPSETAREELYLFLETGGMPITEDGHFLAYKRVRNDFKDIHSGRFDNSVGQVLEMAREEVDPNRHNTCSYGFHFCSLPYLASFGDGPTDHIMIVKINPKDVVSIPSDYKNTKGRTCRYEVVGEHKVDLKQPIPEAFSRSVHSDDEWREDDFVEAIDENVATYKGDEQTESQSFIDAYCDGYSDGRAKLSPAFDLTSTSQAEDIRGYIAGYKDGRGKKKRRYYDEESSGS